jgi:hypothetical protein
MQPAEGAADEHVVTALMQMASNKLHLCALPVRFARAL